VKENASWIGKDSGGDKFVALSVYNEGIREKSSLKSLLKVGGGGNRGVGAVWSTREGGDGQEENRATFWS